MQCVVGGQATVHESIACRYMSFGQGCPELSAVPYQIRMDRGSFIDEIRGIYDRFLVDMIADERDDADVRHLRELGWPPIEEVASREDDLLPRVVKGFLAKDVVNRLLPPPRRAQRAPAYMIDSVDEVRAEGDTVVLTGRSYPFDAKAFAG